MSSLITDSGINVTLMLNNASGSQAPLGVSASGSGSAFSEEDHDASSGNGSSSTELSGESGAFDIFSGGSASGSGGVSDSGSASGVASAAGDGSTSGEVTEQYTASALLRVSAEDGGIQCSDVGQYECIAGSSPQAGGIINITVSVAIAGKLNKELASLKLLMLC